jgi:hypothetical protein
MKWIKGFPMVKEMRYLKGGVYEEDYFCYLCGLDNALRKYVARIRSQRGK